ncbi:BgTH12-07611, partial [Blumeria graminis f. sp. triticale]
IASIYFCCLRKSLRTGYQIFSAKSKRCIHRQKR